MTEFPYAEVPVRELMELVASGAELRGLLEKLEARVARIEQAFARDATRIIERRMRESLGGPEEPRP